MGNPEETSPRRVASHQLEQIHGDRLHHELRVVVEHHNWRLAPAVDTRRIPAEEDPPRVGAKRDQSAALSRELGSVLLGSHVEDRAQELPCFGKQLRPHVDLKEVGQPVTLLAMELGGFPQSAFAATRECSKDIVAGLLIKRVFKEIEEGFGISWAEPLRCPTSTRSVFPMKQNVVEGTTRIDDLYW